MQQIPSAPRTAQARLVLWGGTGGTHPKASLYALDANPFSTPLFSFALQPDQVLPRTHPGDVVEVRGEMRAGARPVIDAGGTLVTPASGLVAGAGALGMRLFAERGDVLGHPAVVGWRPDWRYTRMASVEPVGAWRRRLRTEIWGGRVSLGVALLTAAALVVDALRGRTAVYAVGSGAGGTGLVSYRLARRSRRALEQAERSLSRPAVPMLMRLQWTAGHGQGPMAVATLTTPDDHEGSRPVAHVSVVNVPAGYAPDGLVPCQVIGDPTRAPVIRVPDGDLWPAENAQLALGRRRLRFWRPRA